MAKLFSDNAFNVLGLASDASQKDINRRAKELTNLLKIDEIPDYDEDLSFIKPKRTETNVKTALQNLTSPTKRIAEYFFWFDKANVDETDFSKLAGKQLQEVIAKWGEQGQSETAKGFIAKRNLAVLLSIAAGVTKSQVNRSILTWQSIIDSDKFWSSFSKIYQLSDELGTSADAISDFRSSAAQILADYYADLSKETGDKSYVSAFQKAFNIKGAKVEKELLNPIYQKINDVSSKLGSLKISDEKIISDKKYTELKGLVIQLRNCFEELKDLGLYNDSQSKAMRDKAAEAMRSVGLDLYNNLKEANKSGSILKIAIEICGTPTLKARLEDDLADLRKYATHDKIVQPINELLEAQNWADALDEITEQQHHNTKDKELQDILLQRLKWGLTGNAGELFKEGEELFNKKKYNEARELLRDNVEFILSYLEDTDISRDYVDNVLAEVSRLVGLMGGNQNPAQAVENLRNNVLEQSDKYFKDKFEGTLLVLLVDSAIYANLAEKIPVLKRQKNIKSAVGWAIGIIILLIIGAANSNNNSNSSSGNTTNDSSSSASTSTQTSAQQQACSQAQSIKSQIDQINSEMNTYQSEGDTTDYNNLVPQQNSLVNQYNALVPQCNGTSQ